jgi:hypothetical protein
LLEILHWIATALLSALSPLHVLEVLQIFNRIFNLFSCSPLRVSHPGQNCRTLSVKVLLAGNCRNPLRLDGSCACLTSTVFPQPAVPLAVLGVSRRQILH